MRMAHPYGALRLEPVLWPRTRQRWTAALRRECGFALLGACVTLLAVAPDEQQSSHVALATSLGELNRRALVMGAGVATAGAVTWEYADAFENRLYVVDEKKKPGKQPTNIGGYARKPGALPDLAGCGTTPNCFSSAATSENNTFRFDPELERQHLLEPWTYAYGGADAAFADLQQAMKEYPPGQRGIDGGGFLIKIANAERRYLYAQFESLKFGYIDDVELLVRPDFEGSESGEIRVRSASRQGKLDFGVNAKRLNRLAENLVAIDSKKWIAPLITNEKYPEYVKANR